MSMYAQNLQLERQLAATLASGILASGGAWNTAATIEGAAEQGVAVLNAVLAALTRSAKERTNG